MCLSIVAKIIEIFNNGTAKIELGNVRKNIILGLLEDDIKVGDFVLIHTGFAIAKVDEEKAKQIMEQYETIENLIV